MNTQTINLSTRFWLIQKFYDGLQLVSFETATDLLQFYDEASCYLGEAGHDYKPVAMSHSYADLEHFAEDETKQDMQEPEDLLEAP